MTESDYMSYYATESSSMGSVTFHFETDEQQKLYYKSLNANLTDYYGLVSCQITMSVCLLLICVAYSVCYVTHLVRGINMYIINRIFIVLSGVWFVLLLAYLFYCHTLHQTNIDLRNKVMNTIRTTIEPM